MSTEASLAARARVHAALGDPSRLAITDRLQAGDLSPGEIAASMSLPSNLLAHHLNVLEQAGVVERVRSEGDRRRTYVRLVVAALPGASPSPVRLAPRVVFVCTHNSARSQLAVALWARSSRVPGASAGIHPARRVHPGAVAVARRHRLRVRAARTAHVDTVLRANDLVVAVCDSAHEELAGPHERLHWSVPDPVRAGGDAAFEQAFTVISDRVARLATTVALPEEHG
jgi:ArsR family transcriptional regulator, arsenate/arsenite/antimonite-responsive transcriptional repressor / arsenate reductase (thioredoxin)